MKDWQTDLTSDGKSLGSVSISEGHPPGKLLCGLHDCPGSLSQRVQRVILIYKQGNHGRPGLYAKSERDTDSLVQSAGP